MKLQKIVSRLQELHPKEIDLKLDRILNLCKKLDNPQDKINAISVIGTNAKYSTIQAIYAILKEAKINLGEDYPYPIVDIKISREKALAAYEKIK